MLGRRNRTSCHCVLCLAPVESVQHLLTECRATASVRERLLPELLNLVVSIDPNSAVLDPDLSRQTLTQFILDPTSLNLSNKCRISPSHPRLHELFNLSRDWCHAITSNRKKHLYRTVGVSCEFNCIITCIIVIISPASTNLNDCYAEGQ